MIAAYGVVSQKCRSESHAVHCVKVDLDNFPDKTMSTCQLSNRSCWEGCELAVEEMPQVALVFCDVE